MQCDVEKRGEAHAQEKVERFWRGCKECVLFRSSGWHVRP